MNAYAKNRSSASLAALALAAATLLGGPGFSEAVAKERPTASGPTLAALLESLKGGGADDVEAVSLEGPSAELERALAAVGPSDTPIIAQALADRGHGATIRVALASALGRLGTPEALAALEAAASDPSGIVAVEALGAIGGYGERGRAARPTVEKVLIGSEHAALRIAAVATLGRMRDPAAAHTHAPPHADRAPLGRASARAVLVDLVRRPAEAPVLAKLADLAAVGRATTTRVDAVAALGALVTSESEQVGLLVTLAGKDASDEVRATAIRAIGAISTAEARTTLLAAFDDPRATIRAAACDAVVSLPREHAGQARRILERALTDESTEVSNAARRALEKIGTAFDAFGTFSE
jgi:HEAT repeat protein